MRLLAIICRRWCLLQCSIASSAGDEKFVVHGHKFRAWWDSTHVVIRYGQGGCMLSVSRCRQWSGNGMACGAWREGNGMYSYRGQPYWRRLCGKRSAASRWCCLHSVHGERRRHRLICSLQRGCHGIQGQHLLPPRRRSCCGRVCTVGCRARFPRRLGDLELAVLHAARLVCETIPWRMCRFLTNERGTSEASAPNGQTRVELGWV